MANFFGAIRVKDNKKVSVNIDNIIFIAEIEEGTTRILFNVSEGDGVKSIVVKGGYDDINKLIHETN